MGESKNATSEEGQNYSERHSESVSRRLGSARSKGKGARVSRESRTGESDRPWGNIKSRQDYSFGGIGSRLIATLTQQRQDLASHLEAARQSVAEYEAKLQQIDRELTEVNELLTQSLETENL